MLKTATWKAAPTSMLALMLFLVGNDRGTMSRLRPRPRIRLPLTNPRYGFLLFSSVFSADFFLAVSTPVDFLPSASQSSHWTVSQKYIQHNRQKNAPSCRLTKISSRRLRRVYPLVVSQSLPAHYHQHLFSLTSDLLIGALASALHSTIFPTHQSS